MVGYAPHRDVEVSRKTGCRERPPHRDVEVSRKGCSSASMRTAVPSVPPPAALLLPCRAQHSSFPGQHRMSGATGCAANPPYKYLLSRICHSQQSEESDRNQLDQSFPKLTKVS